MLYLRDCTLYNIVLLFLQVHTTGNGLTNNNKQKSVSFAEIMYFMHVKDI